MKTFHVRVTTIELSAGSYYIRGELEHNKKESLNLVLPIVDGLGLAVHDVIEVRLKRISRVASWDENEKPKG